MVSKEHTTGLMIPLAVLKQAGLTELASLTASKLASAEPTDGGAVEPLVLYAC